MMMTKKRPLLVNALKAEPPYTLRCNWLPGAVLAFARDLIQDTPTLPSWPKNVAWVLGVLVVLGLLPGVCDGTPMHGLPTEE
jgi:hypothetical protein